MKIPGITPRQLPEVRHRFHTMSVGSVSPPEEEADLRASIASDGRLTAREPPDTESLPNGRIGRRAEVSCPAGFRVNQPFRRPVWS